MPPPRLLLAVVILAVSLFSIRAGFAFVDMTERMQSAQFARLAR